MRSNITNLPTQALSDERGNTTVALPLVVVQAADIANAASLTAAIDLSAGRLTRIGMPAAWTAADLTFQTSTDGVTFNDLYDPYGAEYVVKAAASRAVLVPYADFIGVRYFKIRSGTASAPVPQGGARTLNLTLVP